MLKTFLLKHWYDVLIIVIIATCAGIFSYRHWEDQKTILDLQNQNASLQQTVQIKDGLFEKQVLQTNSVKNDLDASNAQNQALQDQLKKTGQQLADETSLNLTLKNAYTVAVTASQTVIPNPSSSPTTTTGVTLASSRIRVDFSQNFGLYSVKGYTLTSPPEGQITLTQTQPLKLTVAMSKDSSGVYHTYVTSSDQNMNINIESSAIDTSVQEPHWYEKVGFQASFGVGTTNTGSGVLAGIGPTLDLGSKQQFTVGPSFWIDVTNSVSKYYGATFLWRPFVQR
jgi:hypothetical protein